MSDDLPDTPAGEFLLYTTEDGKARVECRFENETLWLSQALMAELFETTPQNITLHLKALYEDGEIASKTNGRSNTTASKPFPPSNTLPTTSHLNFVTN